MKKFIITEIEQIAYYFTVEAETAQEARETFSDMYTELWESGTHKTEFADSYVYDVKEVTDNEATSIN